MRDIPHYVIAKINPVTWAVSGPGIVVSGFVSWEAASVWIANYSLKRMAAERELEMKREALFLASLDSGRTVVH